MFVCCACAGVSELIYCALSLTAKLWLGLFLLINVVVADGSAESILGGGGASGPRGVLQVNAL